VGRLAQYRYYNMDQCVGAALKGATYALQRMGVQARPVDEEQAGLVPSIVPLPAANPAQVPAGAD
jgi:hypothetical protein